jgi:hypothetical protein
MKRDPLRCCEAIMCGIQYGMYYSEEKTDLGDPYHYDGVSEWQCEKCGKRIGRWSMKELKDGEFEKPYGD